MLTPVNWFPNTLYTPKDYLFFIFNVPITHIGLSVCSSAMPLSFLSDIHLENVFQKFVLECM